MEELLLADCLDTVQDEVQLAEIYSLEIFSQDGNTVRFGELVAGKGDCITTIVIFVRHFFCAFDQGYVRSISSHITDAVLSTFPPSIGPAQLIIIGCGNPSLIVPYIAETSSAFPVFSDPTGRIYEKFQMRTNFEGISTPPIYAKGTTIRHFLTTFRQMFRSGLRAFQGGSWTRNGGEAIFKAGKLQSMHRMENITDHLTAEKLVEILKSGGRLDDAASTS